MSDQKSFKTKIKKIGNNSLIAEYIQDQQSDDNHDHSSNYFHNEEMEEEEGIPQTYQFKSGLWQKNSDTRIEFNLHSDTDGFLEGEFKRLISHIQPPQPELSLSLMLNQLKLNESNLYKMIPQANRRHDDRNFTENFARKLMTLTNKAIFSKSKYESKKQQFLVILKSTRSKFCQMVLFFYYQYFRYLRVQQQLLHEIGNGLLSFLNEIKSKYSSKMTLQRLETNRQVINHYYISYDGKNIDQKWLLDQFAPFCQKKQKDYPYKYLGALRWIRHNFHSFTSKTNILPPPNLFKKI